MDLTARDAVGNISTPVALVLEQDVTKPAAPALDAYPNLTSTSPLRVTGSKEAGTAVYVDGMEVVAADDETSFSLSLDLAEGGNSFDITLVDAAGNVSDPTRVSATLDTQPPAAPTIDPYPALTNKTPVLLTGGKEADSAIDVDGLKAVPADASTTWTVFVPLVEGSNTLTVTARDAAGNPSTGVLVEILYDATAPKVSSTMPADGAAEVDTNATVSVVFDEPVLAATVNVGTVYLSTAGNPVAASLRVEGDTVHIDVASLLLGQTYTGTVTTGVTDLAGNPLAAEYTWSFTVRDAAWSPIEIIDTGPGTNGYVALDVARDGTAVAAWLRIFWDNGTKYELYAARHDGSSWGAPEPIGLSGASYGMPTSEIRAARQLRRCTCARPTVARAPRGAMFLAR